MNELKGEYIFDFYDVKEYIEKHAQYTQNLDY